jgi:hypothetical protein
MTWDIPEQDLDHSSECLPERWGKQQSLPKEATRQLRREPNYGL